ncbi:MAG: Biotin carboxylase [Alphaproteobacteria bacterium MarineAlpha5_Bin12]|nr:MAG: Biotin carboxylase [Alphaproteobacteria bacterium MarineAlpha5_Bin12]|tara:strand:+ start:2169 stop:3503 length:1335 start_codon:yes stop_codon:yes gene_type:complete
MFKKILIANRGEIALRILRACRELDIKTVAIHSEADAEAMHVRLADESVCVGPAPAKNSYLNIPSIITAATITNSDAIHPGYGFLSENYKFAKILEEHGYKFIGPKSKHIEIMGNKIIAKETMKNMEIPLIPGIKEIKSDKQVYDFVEKNGYPVIVKAASGGGGKGMKIIRKESEIKESLLLAKKESKNAFNDDTIYLEKFLEKPKHIEIQIIADQFNNVIHLGERDCSIQRSHQKIIEESPSSILSEQQRKKIGEISVNAIKSIGYEGLGTIEFLYENDSFYFIEMNTRLQVEHPVTEMVTGVDLVKEQIRIAAGSKLSWKQNDININGHSIECRINAENPKTFKPSPGKITQYHQPGGLGIRVESALFQGYSIPPHYDSMIAKLITYGKNRDESILKMKKALEEYVIMGIENTIQLNQDILKSEDFVSGKYNVNFMNEQKVN